jgi:hypothetical protein
MNGGEIIMPRCMTSPLERSAPTVPKSILRRVASLPSREKDGVFDKPMGPPRGIITRSVSSVGGFFARRKNALEPIHPKHVFPQPLSTADICNSRNTEAKVRAPLEDCIVYSTTNLGIKSSYRIATTYSEVASLIISISLGM